MSTFIEQLAENMHEEWRRRVDLKQGHLDVPYRELAPADQEASRAAARRVSDVLALVGLGLSPVGPMGSDVAPSETDVDAIIEANLERLAEAEHEGWMASRAEAGWSYGAQRDDAGKRHPSMIPYWQLSDAEKDKDRSVVRNYARQVRAAGLAITRLSTR